MPKAPEWFTPPKHVMVEILGGGDCDGLYLDTYSGDPVIAEQALTMYRMSEGGVVGRSHMGIAVGNILKTMRGEEVDRSQPYGQIHFYTLVEKVDEPNTLLLRFHYTAGCAFDHDGTKPGWLNKAIRRFVEANYPDININRIIEFWIGMELRSRNATALERSLIEESYKTGPLEDRCKVIVARLAEKEKIEVEFLIDDELIYFRKLRKLDPTVRAS